MKSPVRCAVCNQNLYPIKESYYCMLLGRDIHLRVNQQTPNWCPLGKLSKADKDNDENEREAEE